METKTTSQTKTKSFNDLIIRRFLTWFWYNCILPSLTNRASNSHFCVTLHSLKTFVIIIITMGCKDPEDEMKIQFNAFPKRLGLLHNYYKTTLCNANRTMDRAL